MTMKRFAQWRIVGFCFSVLFTASTVFAAPARSKLHIEVRWDTNVPVGFILHDNLGNFAVLSATDTRNTLPNCKVSVSTQSGTFDVDPMNGGSYWTSSFMSGTGCSPTTKVLPEWYVDGCLTGSFAQIVSPCYQPSIGDYHPGDPCDLYQSSVAFDLGAASSDVNRRMLLKKQRTETASPIDYPSAFQRSLVGSGVNPDGHLELKVRVATSTGAPKTDTKLYFRIQDPADPAEYAVLNQRSYAGDNRGGAFTLNTTTARTGAATSQTPGYATVMLQANTTPTNPTWAGDNAVVQASLIPFTGNTCPPSTCGETGVITLWKRRYLEQDSMFRSSAFLAGDTIAGEDSVLVDFDADRDGVVDVTTIGLALGSMVRVVHAPRRDGQGDLSFWSEDRQVAGVVPEASAAYPSAQRLYLV